MAEKSITCIICPMGCEITVEGYSDDNGDRDNGKNGRIRQLSGNKCQRGQSYAQTEFLNPKRVVTSTVCLKRGQLPVAPVKTSGGIPKYLIYDVMDLIKSIVVEAPVRIGDRVAENIAGTGEDIVITADIMNKHG